MTIVATVNTNRKKMKIIKLSSDNLKKRDENSFEKSNNKRHP